MAAYTPGDQVNTLLREVSFGGCRQKVQNAVPSGGRRDKPSCRPVDPGPASSSLAS